MNINQYYKEEGNRLNDQLITSIDDKLSYLLNHTEKEKAINNSKGKKKQTKINDEINSKINFKENLERIKKDISDAKQNFIKHNHLEYDIEQQLHKLEIENAELFQDSKILKSENTEIMHNLFALNQTLQGLKEENQEILNEISYIKQYTAFNNNNFPQEQIIKNYSQQVVPKQQQYSELQSNSNKSQRFGEMKQNQSSVKKFENFNDLAQSQQQYISQASQQINRYLIPQRNKKEI